MIHDIELVIDRGKHLRDGGGVGDHAHSTLDFALSTAGHDGGGLVVHANLEAGGAPVDELDGTLGHDGGDGGVAVLEDDVTGVQQAAGQVLAVTGSALVHQVGELIWAQELNKKWIRG